MIRTASITIPAEFGIVIDAVPMIKLALNDGVALDGPSTF